MPKLNVLGLLDHKPKRETCSFTDPAQPGEVLTLTCKEGEYPDQMLGAALRQTLIEQFVSPPDGRAPFPWPPPPHRPIRWSEALCGSLALAQVLQCPDDPEEIYEAEELAVISVRMPTAWLEVVGWVNGLARVGESGNASAAPEAPSCAPPVTSEEPILGSTLISPTHSGVSTNVLPDGRDYRSLVSARDFSPTT